MIFATIFFGPSFIYISTPLFGKKRSVQANLIHHVNNGLYLIYLNILYNIFRVFLLS